MIDWPHFDRLVRNTNQQEYEREQEPSAMATTASTPNNASKSSSPSCLFYHDESNPHLILRPTAPAIAWNRLKPTTGVEELSLVGLSYYHVLDKILPAWRTTYDDDLDKNDDGDLESNIKDSKEATVLSSEDPKVKLGLQKLHVLSTELWVASHLRSRFSLGVDRVLASLLASPRCHNLRSISIHKACSHKMEEDWQALAQALRHLPLLESLELCDAANYYPEQEEYWTHHSDEAENENIAPMARGPSPPINVDLSSLLYALVLSGCPLHTLKLHLNAHMKGRISLSAWQRFWKRAQCTLAHLSLHMLTMTKSELSHDIDHDEIDEGPTLPPSKTSSVRLEELHLTFVHFDSSATYHAVVMQDLLPMTTHHHLLKSFSCVCPSLTSQHYQHLWTRLFQLGSYPQLHTLSVDTESVFDLVALKKPSADQQNTFSNNNSNQTDLLQVQPLMRKHLEPTVQHLLTLWRERPPFHLKKLCVPVYGSSLSLVQEVACLYQGLAKVNTVLDENTNTLASALSQWQSHHEEHGMKQEDASLDCIFHFVSFNGPALLSSRPSSLTVTEKMDGALHCFS